MKQTNVLALILLVLSLGINLPLQAEWGRTAEDYIRLPLYQDVHICSDGNGGCWAIVQRISEFGFSPN